MSTQQHFLRRGRRYALGDYSSAFSAIHPLVLSWSARVVTNGGATPSDNTIAALSIFCSALDSASITSQIIAMVPLVSDSLIAATTPLIKNAGNDPWTNHNFVSGDLTVNGLVGNGSTKYLDSGVLCSTAYPNTNSAGLTVYVSVNSADTGGVEFQAFQGSTSVCHQLDIFNGPAVFAAFNQTVGQGEVTSATSLFTGYLSGNRTSPTALALYAARSTLTHQALSTGSGSGGSIPALNMWMFAGNNSGTPANFCSHRMSFGAMHFGLTQTQSLAFFNAIQALRQSLGGGYV